MVKSSFVKVLVTGRITKTHIEDKEICSKYESEVMMKSGRGKQVWRMVSSRTIGKERF